MDAARTFLRTQLPLLAGVILLFPLPEQAAAHSVHIFAWAEDGRICSESYFARSSRVRDGEAVMADAQGRVLARSRTDEKGLACFPLPDTAQDLTFSILAGQGHRGEFALRAVDLAAAFPSSLSSPEISGEEAHTLSSGEEAPADTTSSGAAPKAAPPVAGQAEDVSGLQAVVRRELQRQLAPIHQALAEIQEGKGPGLREIIGGIGWIMGLAALAQWGVSRRKKPAENPPREKG